MLCFSHREERALSPFLCNSHGNNPNFPLAPILPSRDFDHSLPHLAQFARRADCGHDRYRLFGACGRNRTRSFGLGRHLLHLRLHAHLGVLLRRTDFDGTPQWRTKLCRHRHRLLPQPRLSAPALHADSHCHPPLCPHCAAAHHLFARCVRGCVGLSLLARSGHPLHHGGLTVPRLLCRHHPHRCFANQLGGHGGLQRIVRLPAHLRSLGIS